MVAVSTTIDPPLKGHASEVFMAEKSLTGTADHMAGAAVFLKVVA